MGLELSLYHSFYSILKYVNFHTAEVYNEAGKKIIMFKFNIARHKNILL